MSSPRLLTEDLDPEEKRRREEEDRKREAARLAKDPGRPGKTWKDLGRPGKTWGWMVGKWLGKLMVDLDVFDMLWQMM